WSTACAFLGRRRPSRSSKLYLQDKATPVPDALPRGALRYPALPCSARNKLRRKRPSQECRPPNICSATLAANRDASEAAKSRFRQRAALPAGQGGRACLLLRPAQPDIALGSEDVGIEIGDPLPSAGRHIEVADGSLHVGGDAVPVELRVFVHEVG